MRITCMFHLKANSHLTINLWNKTSYVLPTYNNGSDKGHTFLILRGKIGEKKEYYVPRKLKTSQGKYYILSFENNLLWLYSSCSKHIGEGVGFPKLRKTPSQWLHQEQSMQQLSVFGVRCLQFLLAGFKLWCVEGNPALTASGGYLE
jgi:hypothetical protein